MQLDELTSISELQALLPEWWSLYKRCPSATPFHSPDWFELWWEHFGFGNLWVLAIRAAKRVAGIVPLFVHDYRDEHRSMLRQISPLGIGITDYMDFLFDPEYAASASELVLQHLAARRALWDVADLQGLRESCGLIRVTAPSGVELKIAEDQRCPVIRLPNSADEFLASLSSNRRHTYRSVQRRLRDTGPVSFETASPASWRELMEALFTLDACRQDRNRPIAFGNPGLQGFHRKLSERFANRDWLRLTVMRIGSSIAAALYGFASGS